MRALLNYLTFQAGWIACVTSAAHGAPWLGSAFALCIAGWHIGRSARPRAELRLILLAAAIGAVWDSLLVAGGLIRYPSGMLIANAAPYWIVALWVLFATTLNSSLDWLKRSPVAAVLLGLIGGPLSYLSAARLGALVLARPELSLISLAVGWGILTPILVRLARHRPEQPGCAAVIRPEASRG